MSVFVVGALHLDVIVDAPRLPRIDETLVGRAVAYAFGGKGGNQAVAAARMGAEAAMAGAVGTDEFGDRLLAELDRAGVDRRQVARRPGASGMSVAIVGETGDYGAVIVSGVNREIDPAAIAIPPDARVVVLQSEVPAAVNAVIIRAASESGIPVLWNAAPVRQESYASQTRVIRLILNRIEARERAGIDDPMAAAEALAAEGYAEVVVTLGAEGVVHSGPSGTIHLPGHPVPVVSTHGAGDAFVGALAARLDAGDSMHAALGFAQAAAALHVSTPVADRIDITPEKVRAFAAGGD